MTAQQADIDARTQLGSLYERRLDELCSVAAAITRDRSSARDIVHEAFVKALRRSAQFRGESDLDAWVWRIVINAAYDHLRRQSRRQAETVRVAGADSVEPNPTFSPMVDVDLAERIQALPKRQRLTIFLRYYADLDYRQIASVLEVAPGTVSAALAAAHATLRRRMTEVAQ